MVDFAVLLKVLSVFIVAVISPGPDFVIVSATALAHGQKEGVKAAGGVATMVAGYTLISLLGIGALLQHYLWLALAIKICGGFLSDLSRFSVMARLADASDRSNSRGCGEIQKFFHAWF